MRVGAGPAVSVPSSGTIRQTWFPGFGFTIMAWAIPCWQLIAKHRLPYSDRWLPSVDGEATRRIHVDLPWRCPEPGEPNTSFKS
jgi:hypothetical protein